MDIYRFSPVSGTLTSAVWPARPTRPRRLEMWSLGWSMMYNNWYNFYGHFNPETFWFLGRPEDTRYDIAPRDQWHSVSKWMQIECCRISFDLFLDPRPSTFRHTVEIWNRINFYIQQNASATQWLLANWPWSFLGTEIGDFHRLGIENRSKSCATSPRNLWTPLLGRSCCANRSWGANVLGCGDWDRLGGNFQAQIITNRSKISQPSWSFSIFQFQHFLISQHILTIF